MINQHNNKWCQFNPCTTKLMAGQGHFVRDLPEKRGRVLCDKHYCEVLELRAIQRRNKKIRREIQPQLDLST